MKKEKITPKEAEICSYLRNQATHAYSHFANLFSDELVSRLSFSLEVHLRNLPHSKFEVVKNFASCLTHSDNLVKTTNNQATNPTTFQGLRKKTYTNKV